MSLGTLLLGLSIGYGLGASFSEWPGGAAASATGLALSAAALVVLYREVRNR